MENNKNLIIVRGAGDIATGTIYRLRRSGFQVAALEIARPTVIRRTVSFAQAVIDGRTFVEDIEAVRCETAEEIDKVLGSGKIPVCVDPSGALIEMLQPEIVVDAILAKRNTGTTIDMAPFVIGLGPGFTAGVDCDAVVETNRGHDLGRVILDGPAQANTGIPGNIGGYTHERVIHSPAAGTIRLLSDICDHVEKDQVIAQIIGNADSRPVPVCSKLDGVLRGMIADGSAVKKGMKIADVDPRDQASYCQTISDKARSVSGGTLEAVMMHCHHAV